MVDGSSTPEMRGMVCCLSGLCRYPQQPLDRPLKHLWQRAGLTLNAVKCNGKLRPQVDKVEAIRRNPRPTTKKEVRSFLGLMGWYQRFIPNFASITTPLTNLLVKNVKKPISWTEDCETAFKGLKEKICSSPVLQSPHFNQHFLVQVDTSATGIGAVLAQGAPGAEKPVVFLSRKLLSRV